MFDLDRRGLGALLALAAIVLALAGSFFTVDGAWAREKARPALPGAAVCPTPLAPRAPPAAPWSEQEQWVWQEVCLGRAADLGNKYDAELDATLRRDPERGDLWSERRVLTPEFLETILLHAPYRTAVPRSGVMIDGALYRDRVDLSWSRLTSLLLLKSSRFEKGAVFDWALASKGVSLAMSSFGTEAENPSLSFVHANLGFLNLSGSSVAGPLLLADMRVSGDIDLSAAVLAGDVDATGAKIAGDLSADGVKVAGHLNMESIEVDGNAFMNAPAELATVDMLAGDIGGDLMMGGVTVRGAFSMQALTVGGTLFMDESAKIDGVDLIAASIEGDLSLTDVRSKGPIILDSISVAGDLYLDKTARAESVSLFLARIGRDILMDGASVAGAVNMGRVSTGGDITLRAPAEVASVDLSGADVGGWARFNGTAFSGSLTMAGATFAGDLELVALPEVEDVDLTRAKVAGAVYLSESKFAGSLTLTGVDVGASLHLKDAVLSDDLSMSFARVGSNLILSGATLNLADLTAVSIGGDLVLGHLGDPVVWSGEQPLLVLRNAKAGALQDLRASWPANLSLDLGGFSYARLGGVSHSLSEDALASRQSDWFVAWLSKDQLYSPQPYEQLASVLQAMGHEAKAKDVLYGGRNRARFAADEPWYTKLWQGLMLLLIGFGYRTYYAVGWIALFVVLGAAVVRRTGEGKRAGIRFGLAYSLDTLLPIIKLREAHYDIDFAGGWRPARYYFYFHQMMGYVLASFLVAGLSGLTK